MAVTARSPARSGRPPLRGGAETRRRALSAALLAGALALAGCSGGQGDGALDESAQFAGLDRIFGGERAATEAPPPLVIVAAPGAAQGRLRAELPTRNAQAILRFDGRNDTVTTWRTQDAVSLGLADPGVLIATRGLGEDLHIADAAQTIAALADGRGGSARRTHVTVGADQQARGTGIDCTLATAGRETLTLGERQRPALRIEERCDGPQGSFTNIYWRDPTRPVIWQSVQWIGPEVGSIRLQFLSD